jgi:prepilin-type N-terminal cleavage/methylation domain-containing protein
MDYLPGRAFTLVELLVVVSLIVVLLALLTPALDQAIEQAERVVCASNLHAHHGGLASYAFDHRRKLLKTARHYGHLRPYANVPYVYQDIYYGDWSLEGMKPYVGGIGAQTVGGVWICPSNRVAPANKDVPYRDALRAGRGRWLAAWDGAWIHCDYSLYSGGLSAFPTFASRPQDLVDKSFEPGKLLMADSIYRHQDVFYWYNHGEFAWGPGKPAITGINKLYGDGSAEWDGRFNEQRNEAIYSGNPAWFGEFVSSHQNDGAARIDVSFYGGPLPQ